MITWFSSSVLLALGAKSVFVFLVSFVVMVQTLSPPITYFGMCDASAAVAVGSDAFVVANDEDNVIRIYQREPPALPATSLDLTAFLGVGGKREVDLEGAARIGNRIFWIASHGRDAKGAVSPDRHRFFATSVTTTGTQLQLQPVGQPYRRLLEDFYAEARLRPFQLDRASQLAPKLPGALNIEGLVATPDGQLLIGFRSPVPEGRALMIPLLNPAAIVQGERARLGDPILLNLGGLGVRSLGWGNGKYFIIAGHSGDGGVSRLYEWGGPGTAPALVEAISFAGSNPEGIAFDTVQGTQDLFVLSDDGALVIDGVGCRRLKDPAKKRFRSYKLELQ